MNQLTTLVIERYISSQRYTQFCYFARLLKTLTMSLTLGEKLRQAREERGITLSEVAEQTRISPLYLESIEHDDYRNLPGGIFNKGFVKTFAKYVGVNEQEALQDYTRLIDGTDVALEAELKLYKPEVLTDDRSTSSKAPTIIGAIVILALMTGGILFLVNYLRQPAAPSANTAVAANSNSNKATNTQSDAPSVDAPSMATLKVDVKAVGQPVLITSTTDGVKTDSKVAADSSVSFTPKESLTLNYNRWNFKAVQMTINGKMIALPSEPLDHKGQRIEFTINKDNIAQILSRGSVSTEVPTVVTDANTNTAAPTTGTTAPTQPRPTPAVKPSPAAANTAANTATKPPANTKPISTPAKPPPTMTGKPPGNKPPND